ncbi:hypothetical protein GE09DRAFT_1222404 [Coniochaeta sp. 2T2.1]|nr:hypothetical protein GE09DRAFT_1222404 [Coniochaeta sp. 2T2.1]
MCSSDIFLGVLALLFPPLPVWVKRGICSADSLINILLCCLGYLPGLIHAWYIIAKYPEPGYDYEPLQQDAEGRVYVIVRDSNGRQYRQQQPQHGGQQQQAVSNSNNKKPGQPNTNMSYGTTSAPAPAGQNNAGEGSSNGEGNHAAAPPSYAQVVAGDHKVQTQD